MIDINQQNVFNIRYTSLMQSKIFIKAMIFSVMLSHYAMPLDISKIKIQKAQKLILV